MNEKNNGYIRLIANKISELVYKKNKDYNNSFDKSIEDIVGYTLLMLNYLKKGDRKNND